MEIDPAVLTLLGLLFTFLGGIVTFLGGFVTEKIRAKVSEKASEAATEVESESNAVQLVTVLLQRQTQTDALVMELKASFDSLSWRYFLAMRSLSDHREEWPEEYIDRLPSLHPIIADDLLNGPSFGPGKEN